MHKHPPPPKNNSIKESPAASAAGLFLYLRTSMMNPVVPRGTFFVFKAIYHLPFTFVQKERTM
jgi:hypothetical protein